MGNNEEIKPKWLIPEIIAAAYECGKLLDIIRCEKWLALKKLTPKRDPVYASFDSSVFWLHFSERAGQLQARTVLKSEEQARKCAQALSAQGVCSYIRT